MDSLQREIAPLADLKALRAILAILRQGEYDVVDTHISKSGLFGRLAARREAVTWPSCFGTGFPPGLALSAPAPPAKG